MSDTFAACDLGAESGRVMLATLSDGRMHLEEVHRFLNGPVRVRGSMHWDVLGLFQQLKTGLSAAARSGRKLRSLSVDSWGVDYVWCAEGLPHLAVPFHYRDARTAPMFEEAMRVPGEETIFQESGLQFLPFNTLYQFMDDARRFPSIIGQATHFLFIADFLNALFSGRQVVERSLASTSQLYNPVEHDWSARLADASGVPRGLFPEIVDSGTVLGSLDASAAEETSLHGVDVVASCSHDTASAVAAVPAEGEDWAYLSSGTWSLLGVELCRPIIDARALAGNFTNEIGHGRTVRFLKNISGLWILQECRRAWSRAGVEYDYGQLTQMAAAAEPFRSLIDPNDARFLAPDSMPERMREFCRETGQPEPEEPPQYVRCILESLALHYRLVLDDLREAVGRDISRLHVVGGGSRNVLLNQFAANALELPVLAGPVEATAYGNALIQAIGCGLIDCLETARAILRESIGVERFVPENTVVWREALTRMRDLGVD